VHLSIIADPLPVDAALTRKMHNAQRVVYITRGLREKTKMKTRQPLQRILVATHDADAISDIEAMRDVICEETNIKDIEFVASDSELVSKSARPLFKAIGPKYGKLVNPVANRIKAFGRDEIAALEQHGEVTIDIDGTSVTVAREDVEILHEDIQGWTIGADGDLVVALDTTLTDELVDEGLAREFVNRIQNLRKERGFEVTDRIVICVDTPDERLAHAITAMEASISNETLAVKILNADIPENAGSQFAVNEFGCRVYISIALPG
jgi:isoleucyl-tRNA synthetase